MEAPIAAASGGLTARTRQSRSATLVIMGVTAAIIAAVAFMVNQPTATADGFTSVTSPAAPGAIGKAARTSSPRLTGGGQARRLQGKPRLAELRGELVPALPGGERHPGRLPEVR